MVWILVSNAGVALQGGMADVEIETVDTSIDVNFKGALHCARGAIGIMRAQGTGG